MHKIAFRFSKLVPSDKCMMNMSSNKLKQLESLAQEELEEQKEKKRAVKAKMITSGKTLSLSRRLTSMMSKSSKN